MQWESNPQLHGKKDDAQPASHSSACKNEKQISFSDTKVPFRLKFQENLSMERKKKNLESLLIETLKRGLKAKVFRFNKLFSLFWLNG